MPYAKYLHARVPPSPPPQFSVVANSTFQQTVLLQTTESKDVSLSWDIFVFARSGEVLAPGTFAAGAEVIRQCHVNEGQTAPSPVEQSWQESGNLPLFSALLADTPAVLIPPGGALFSGWACPPPRTGVCHCPLGLTFTSPLFLAALPTVAESCSSIFFWFEAASEVPRRLPWHMGTQSLTNICCPVSQVNQSVLGSRNPSPGPL